MRTLCRQLSIRHKAKDTKTIVDSYQNDILLGPFLTIKLWLCAPAFTIASTMNPQGNRKFLIHLSRSLGVDIQIKTVLTIWSLISIAPLCGITARIVYCLISRMTKLRAVSHTFPLLNGLWFFPTEITNRSSGIRDSLISEYTWCFCYNTLNLPTLNIEDWTFGTLLIRGATNKHCR